MHARCQLRQFPIGVATRTAILTWFRIQGVEQKCAGRLVIFKLCKRKIRSNAKRFEYRDGLGQLIDGFRLFVAVKLHGIERHNFRNLDYFCRSSVDKDSDSLHVEWKVLANLY